MSTTLSTKDLLEFIKDGDNIEERLSNQSDVVRLLLRNLISMKKSFLGSEKKSRDELFDRSAKIILDIKFTALELIDKKTEFVFGSRIKKIDNTIERRWFRFIIGRMIATAISKVLNLAVYDTQCGCKLFSRNTAQLAFKTSFISPWLFDVEIFFRLKNYYGIRAFKTKSAEIPLKNWRDQGESKIQWTYGFKMWFDLLKIKRAYT